MILIVPQKMTNNRVNAIFEKADPHVAKELILDSIYNIIITIKQIKLT